MKSSRQNFSFNKKILVLALLAAINPAQAEDDDVAKLISPNSSVASFGLGTTNGNRDDRALFGQYTEWHKYSTGLLIDYELINRDDTKGLWTNVEMRNLGLDNQGLLFSQQQQGNWKFVGQYDRQVRHEPRTIGWSNGDRTEPELKRDNYSASVEKFITQALSIEASAKNENKSGSRLFGVGNYCSNAISGYSCTTTLGSILLIPEPITSTTRQFEAKVNYAGKGFLLSGGYYGSFHKNGNKTITPVVPSTIDSQLAAYLSQPVALPPDNQAHQFFVTGNYAVTPTTHTNFYAAHTVSKQNDGFGNLVAVGGPADLGGKQDKILLQIGVTAQPIPKLSLLGNLRKETLKDYTPMNYFANTPSSLDKESGKLEASYRLPNHCRATVGIDYDAIKRARPIDTTNIPATSLTALRENTAELGVRAEMKHTVSDTLNAAISLAHAKREGGHWIGLVADSSGRYPTVRDDSFALSGNTSGTFPTTLMDRTRNKIKLLADWAATDQLTLQFMIEDGRDEYNAPTTAGARDSGMRNIAIDADLNLSYKWKLTGYINYGEQTLHVNHGVGYIAELENTTTSLGLGAIGKLSSRLEVGGDLGYTDDQNQYNLGSNNAQAPGVLQDVTYRATTLKLFGQYALNKKADVQVDFAHQRLKLNEWTWSSAGVPFTYSNNATVSMQPNQKVTYLGAKYVYKFD